MIINADGIASKAEIATDYCIIGSGIAGSTLAKELSIQGKDFCIIEAGSFKRSDSSISWENIGREFGLSSTRAFEIGGTSNLWHGVLAPLDRIDFEKRNWIPQSGWPISYHDLLPYYQKASKHFGFHKYEYFDKKKLTPDLHQKIKQMKFTRGILNNKMFQQPQPPMRFKKNIIKICANSRHHHCYYNAVALELMTTSNKQNIHQLKAGTKNGFILFRAKTYIVCCGALETPRLLLNSRSSITAGLGNQGDNLGRYLMDHPMGNFIQIEFHKIKKAHIYADSKYGRHSKIKTGLVLQDKIQKSRKLPNHCFYMRPSFIKGIHNESEQLKLSLLTMRDGKMNAVDFWKIIYNWNIILQIVGYKYSLNTRYKYADLFFVTEQVPNPNSRITLSGTKDQFGYPIASINWRLTPYDIDCMDQWYNILRSEALRESECVFTHNFDDLNWSDIFTSAAHHVGTARMSDSVKTGVVDVNLKVYGTNNLYVCDGSVFPTSGNVNSGYTISALACRLSDHFRKKHK